MDQIVTQLNLQLFREEALKIYSLQYFQYITGSIFFIIAFFLGRLFQEKKFSNLLNMINDAETTSRKLTTDKLLLDQKIKKIQQKKYLLFGLISLLLATFFFYTNFIIQKIEVTVIVQFIICVVSILILLWLSLRYLKWKRSLISKKLQKSVLTTQNELKQILNQIGSQISTSLKIKFQRQIINDRKKEDLKECNLSKCYHEKKAYEKLYNLYKTIINELTKFNWCTVCSSQANINISELKMSELDSNLNLYQKLAQDSKFTIDRQKQITNRMLEKWTSFQPKLSFICKKGCCIKFRQIIEGLKKEHYKSLNDLKANLKTS